MSNIAPGPEGFSDITPSPREAARGPKVRASRGRGVISEKPEGPGAILDISLSPSAISDISPDFRIERGTQSIYFSNSTKIDRN